ICNSRGVDEEQFEVDLYLIRRRIEKAVIEESIKDFYICSLSCRSVIYKGMFLAEQLTAFYPDLLDERFVSNFAVYHQRYSTNTFPTWHLAQPFRVIAHNGEINTLKGNLNWMKAHETRMSTPVYGEQMEAMKPIVQPGGSDSAALDNVFEALVGVGRDLPMVKALLIPDVWAGRQTMPKAHRDFYSYCNSVMEPWDGPAAICAFAGNWVIAGMDRNGLRPMRYTITGDGLLLAGSEAGMVRVDETTIVEKGRVGPGQMLGINLAEGRLYRPGELVDELSKRASFSDWVKNITVIDSLVRNAPGEPAIFPREELARRHHAAGFTMEDLEVILHPMVEEAKEAVGSMGDDTPLAVLADQYRGLHHFFRQNFSQVTNPPIDSLRESRVMSLKTRLGNLGNVLDQEASQCNLLQLESPVLSNAEFLAMRDFMGSSACVVDATFAAAEGEAGLRAALERIRREAEEGVRAGCTH